MTTAQKLREVKTYKIGDNSEEGKAATTEELIECECCGRKIANVTILSNGIKVGSECAAYLTRPDWRTDERTIKFYFGRRNRKADKYIAEGGWA